MVGNINIKKITFFTFFVGILILSCSSKKRIFTENLTFEIINKKIKDNEKLKVKLTNNTHKDYYLVLDTINLFKPFSFFSSNYFSSTLTFLIDSKGKEISKEVVDYECYSMDKEYFEEQNKIFKSRTIKSLLKIKSHSSLIFYAPFKIKTIVKEECWYGNDKRKLNDKKGYFVEFKYFSKYKSALTTNMCDSLKNLGYEIYDKAITSNKIPLILEND